MASDINRGVNPSVKVLLPELSGSKRIKGHAYRIRDAYRAIAPEAPQLKTETDAHYWIRNKDWLLKSNKLGRSLPRLNGAATRVRWAFTIRARLADIFPEAPLLRSQIDAEFWIANKRVFECAVKGYQDAECEKN